MDIFYPIKIFADWITYAVFGLVPKTIFGSDENKIDFDFRWNCRRGNNFYGLSF